MSESNNRAPDALWSPFHAKATFAGVFVSSTLAVFFPLVALGFGLWNAYVIPVPVLSGVVNRGEDAIAKDHERRYAIQPHDCYGFYTGVTPTKEQVLMGLFWPNLIAFRFDVDGNLLGTELRPVPFSPPYDIYDNRVPPVIEAWKNEMCLREATIKVKKFSSEEHYIFIEDYPSHFHEILSDQNADDEEKADIRDSMKSWDMDGQFVLQWGNDYWLDDAGEVVSS